MNRAMIAGVLRSKARRLIDEPIVRTAFSDASQADVCELLNVLARIVEGKPVGKAFGAPSDWVYGTPIANALAAREDCAMASASSAHAERLEQDESEPGRDYME